MGRIEINKMQFYSNHGAYESEKFIKQLFLVSVFLQYDFKEAALNDDLSKTINYAEIVSICTKHMQKRQALLETLVVNIANEISATYSGLLKILVEIEKPQVQMGINLEGVKVSYTL